MRVDKQARVQSPSPKFLGLDVSKILWATFLGSKTKGGEWKDEKVAVPCTSISAIKFTYLHVV